MAGNDLTVKSRRTSFLRTRVANVIAITTTANASDDASTIYVDANINVTDGNDIASILSSVSEDETDGSSNSTDSADSKSEFVCSYCQDEATISHHDDFVKQ
eukprot:14607721-Ditylum_brightwellii.AAC.1